MDYDFSGWATRNNIECSDGRIILKDAFKDDDGLKVPLVWNHQHDDPNEVLGHAVLENREDGVYAYCKFNNTESGQTARSLVLNGDVDKLSIYANKLKSQLNNVVHGCIREVSLVLAGANPGAYIDSVITHSEDGEEEEEGTIYTDEMIEVNSEENKSSNEDDNGESNMDDKPEEKQEQLEEKQEQPEEKQEQPEEKQEEQEVSHADDEKTIGEVLDTLTEDQNEVIVQLFELTEKGGLDNADDAFIQKLAGVMDELSDEQKEAVYATVGSLTEEENNEEKGEEEMKHNVFENEAKEETLAHSEFVKAAIADAKRFGSMKDSFIAHAEESGIEWGENNDYDILFPDAHNLNPEPKLVEKDNSWVAKVMTDVHHSPFSRVKNTLGRMDEATARAKGYIKGNKKTNIAMAFLNRVTTPTTVYIKNDIDRDDVVDITDFDIVAWQKREMRKLLDRELALAMLLGDGRDVSDANKINEQNIRPVISDNELYTIHYTVTDGVDYNVEGNSHSENDSIAKGIIRAAIRARKNYKGSGRPTFYTTEDTLTDLLLIEDQNGRVIYDSIDKLATALRVKEIVTIPEMENYTGIYGVIVNMNDYTAGADKGGSVNMFDDFDIDYNQMKYLIETRMSGALTTPLSAIVLEKEGNTSNGAEG